MLVYQRVAAIAGANHHFWIQQTLGAESVVTVQRGFWCRQTPPTWTWWLLWMRKFQRQRTRPSEWLSGGSAFFLLYITSLFNDWLAICAGTISPANMQTWREICNKPTVTLTYFNQWAGSIHLQPGQLVWCGALVITPMTMCEELWLRTLGPQE